MRKRGFAWAGALTAGSLLAACGGGQVSALSQGDLPSGLGLAINPGATLHRVSSLTGVGCHVEEQEFTPPGKRQLPFDGGGEAIPYTELIVVTSTCSTVNEARHHYALDSSSTHYREHSLRRLGSSSKLVDASNTANFPASNTYSVILLVGHHIGVAAIEAPDTVKAVNEPLMLTLARRMAANLAAG